MGEYRNITANIGRPRTLLDKTARAILLTLNGATRPLTADDFRRNITRRGGDPRYQGDGVKALRNMGYRIECTKARHHTKWWIDPTPVEAAAARERRIRESYSAVVSAARSLAGHLLAMPGDATVVATHKRSVQSAIDLGTDVAMGMTIAEVVADCEPLTV